MEDDELENEDLDELNAESNEATDELEEANAESEQTNDEWEKAKEAFKKGQNETLGQEYFKKPAWDDKILELPFVSIPLIIIGGAICYSGNWWGLIAVILGASAEINKRMRSSDSGIDGYFADLAEQKLQENMGKSQVVDSNDKAKPLYFIGIDSWNQSKKGKDGIMRFNPMVLVIFRFCKDKLVIDEVQLDAMNPKEYSAKSNEFAYKDISEISIDKKTFSRRFVIKVCGQTEFDIEIAHNQQSNAEDIAREIRKVVRETAGASGESSVESNKDSK